MGELVEGARRIAVLRCSALGDFVVALPALAALHPGAGDSRRRWPPERFAQVGDSLVAVGARVAVTGSAEERGLAESVVRHMRVPAADLSGRLSVGGLLERCRVVVSNDLRPRHLAEALGAATVGVY